MEKIKKRGNEQTTMSTLRVNSIPLRLKFAEVVWDDVLTDVLWSGSSSTTGYWPDFNNPTIFPEQHRTAKVAKAFEMTGGPKAAVELAYDRFGWALHEAFTVDTKEMIKMEMMAVALQLLDDHETIARKQKKAPYFNEGTVVALTSMINELSSDENPASLKDSLSNKADAAHRGAPWFGLAAAVAERLEKDPSITIGKAIKESPDHQKIDYEAHFQVQFQNMKAGLSALVSSLTGESLANGQSRGGKLRNVKNEKGEDMHPYWIRVSDDNWRRTVQWASVELRESLINRNKKDMARKRTIGGFGRRRGIVNKVAPGNDKVARSVLFDTEKAGESADWPVINAVRLLYDRVGVQGAVLASRDHWLDSARPRFALTTDEWTAPSEECMDDAIALLQRAGLEVVHGPGAVTMEGQKPTAPKDDVIVRMVQPQSPPSTSPRKKRKRPAERSVASEVRGPPGRPVHSEAPPPLESMPPPLEAGPAKKARGEAAVAKAEESEGSGSGSGVLIALAAGAALLAMNM